MESYTFDDILAIAKLIPTINREALTNDDLTYWHNQLNKKKRTLTEFINAFTPTNYIDISTFLSVNNPDMYINDTEYPDLIAPRLGVFFDSKNMFFEHSENGRFRRRNHSQAIRLDIPVPTVVFSSKNVSVL